MTKVNLLPWRDARREKEKKEYITLAIMTATFSIIVLGLIYFYVSSLASDQTALNNRLEREILIMDKRIIEINKLKKLRTALISRMSIIQKLQETRPLTVHLVDEIIKVVPKGMYITKIERKGDTVVITGNVESNSSVSIFMRNIDEDHWINHPNLSEIKTVEKQKGSTYKIFRLSFILKPKNAFNLIM